MISEKRPWGEFHVLDEQPGCKVKRIAVNPGQRSSLQSHKHRYEHWTVISGTVTVVIDGTVTELRPAQSIDIPLGARHRLENRTADLATIVEVQFGDYLGEDDIVRYEDNYQRV